MKIRDRVKELRRMRAGDLAPNPKNWRTHPKAQKDALRGILAEVGIADALLARELPDGRLMLIDGHLRADTTPDQIVPVLVLDVDEAEADKLLLTKSPLWRMGRLGHQTSVNRGSCAAALNQSHSAGRITASFVYVGPNWKLGTPLPSWLHREPRTAPGDPCTEPASAALAGSPATSTTAR